MVLPRANLTGLEREQARDVAVVEIRAGSKMGAVLTARVESARSIPLRDQEITRVENMSNDRFLDKWRVHVRDTEGMNRRK